MRLARSRFVAAMALFGLVLTVALPAQEPAKEQSKENAQPKEKQPAEKPAAAEADALDAATQQKAIFESLQKFYEGQEKALPEVLKKVDAYLEAGPLDANHFRTASLVAQVLEMKGQYEKALDLHKRLKETFAKSGEGPLAGAAANSFEAAQKRLGVLGKEPKIEGTLVDGSKFDWSKYQGKVVLVDFWATWCGPCIRELPNVKETYEKYHEKGFEIVGVSLDDDEEQLKQFIEDREIPWENLFGADESTRGWQHPLTDRFGVQGIPFTMLVGRDGQVKALNLRGEDLPKTVGELIEQQPAAEEKPAG